MGGGVCPPPGFTPYAHVCKEPNMAAGSYFWVGARHEPLVPTYDHVLGPTNNAELDYTTKL
jgi:hypothetical protein